MFSAERLRGSGVCSLPEAHLGQGGVSRGKLRLADPDDALTPRTAAWVKRLLQPERGGSIQFPFTVTERRSACEGVVQRSQLCLRLNAIDVIEPTTRARQRPSVERHVGAFTARLPETRPAPKFGARNKIGPQRVSLDVAADLEKVVVSLHRKRLESTLINRAGAYRAVRGMPALRMRNGEPMQEIREIVVSLWPQHEMPMIGHQANKPGYASARAPRLRASLVQMPESRRRLRRLSAAPRPD